MKTKCFTHKFFLLLLILLISMSCNRYQPYVNKDFINPGREPLNPPEYSVFFTGDFDNLSAGHPNIRLLQNMVASAKDETAVILLGNYLYPEGLPDEEDKDYDQKSKQLENLLDELKQLKGELYMLPGNRDWENGGQDGPERIRDLEAYIEDYLDDDQIFVPGGGCPGPMEIDLRDDLTLLVFDSQWWLQNESKYSLDSDCDFDDLETEEDHRRQILVSIRDALERNKDKTVIFAAHHPLYSSGRHGGHFPIEENLFPLTAINNSLWIPLPGFIYTGTRKFLGSYQDLAHPEYKELRKSLDNIFSNYPNVVYLAAHDHNLQYTENSGIHHIVSGAATSADYSAGNRKTDFALQSTGIGKLDFYDNGDVWLEFVVPDEDSKTGKTVFRTFLFNQKNRKNGEITDEQMLPDYSDSTVVKIASTQYNTGKLKRFWMGDNYRDVWNEPVRFPVFDIGAEHGGLDIIKRGGGQQTKSVRLEAPDERQYVLRSVEKYVEGALPDELRGTVAVDIVQDGISQSNPYGALVVPYLADATGVYHTNPQIVFVPDDPRLGIYRREMAGRLYLYEERPDDDRTDVASFGRPEKIESTQKVLKELENKHDHRVDQQSVLRARLLDMVIADWDRHDDQWRWAEFDHDDLTVYRPIPRDRDNTFFVAEGPVQWLTKRKWLQPKFQGFGYDTKNIPGFNYNARFFDRSFLHQTTRDQWQDAAKQMQKELTDDVIENAVKEGFPEEVYPLAGEETISKLKARRDKLPEFADEQYLFLARKVDIPGTDDRDLFVIERLNDNQTKVTGWELSQKKGHIKDIFYQRTFNHDETREIRIYGQKDQDKFIVKGDVNKGILVRIIGGKGRDTIIDESHVRGWSRKTWIYDKKSKNNVLVKSGETRDLRSNRKGVNNYDRKIFRYNVVMPQAYFGYSIDDGAFIGGGVFIKNYNFRDSTFHRLIGNYAYETDAFNIRYTGLISSFIRSFDLVTDVEVSVPNVVGNFYGFGNETENKAGKNGELDREYYRVRYHYGLLRPRLRKTISRDFEVLFGGTFMFGKVERTEGRFIDDLEANGLSEDIFLDQYVAGVNAGFIYDNRDNEDFPTRGILWHVNARRMFDLNAYSGNFTGLSSDLSLYLSFRKDPRMILALRFGGGKNWGDYPFYMAQGLGDKTSLRGFRANRFTGDAAFYQNTELRLKLFHLNTYLLNGNLGILGFNDVGRVWYGDEDSKKWHQGYGFGLWMTPYNMLTMNVSLNLSEEEEYINLRLSYLF